MEEMLEDTMEGLEPEEMEEEVEAEVDKVRPIGANFYTFNRVKNKASRPCS